MVDTGQAPWVVGAVGGRAPAPAREHPGAQRDVARDGGGGARGDQDRELEPARRARRQPVQDRERAARQAEREEEDDGAERVVAQQPGAAAQAEGQRRFAAVFPTAVSASATALAPPAPSAPRSARYSSA